MVTPTATSVPGTRTVSGGSSRAHESTVARAGIGLQTEGLALVLVIVTRRWVLPSCQVMTAGPEIVGTRRCMAQRKA